MRQTIRQIVYLFTALIALIPAAFAGSWSTELTGGMNVQLYTPESAPKLDGKRALMINLHGCGQTAAEMRAGNKWESVADEYGMVVAMPDVPNGGVIAGCWDYYGTDHTRSNRHNDNLLSLVSELQARGTLNIDPRQIYVSGLSSGASQGMVLGCLAPEVFAGVGAVAGPTIGTSSLQVGWVATNKAAAVALCRRLAGSQAGQLQTQIASFAYGTADYFVHQGYSQLNAEVAAELLGAAAIPGTLAVNTGGTERRWHRTGVKAVQLISIAGMAHAWPAGRGTSGGGAWIDHMTIDYPAVLTKFLFCANPRVPGDRGSCDVATGPEEPPEERYCGTAVNTEHAAAGRAIQYGSGTWASYGAAGSYQWLGYGTAQTTLNETSPGFFVSVASCN